MANRTGFGEDVRMGSAQTDEYRSAAHTTHRIYDIPGHGASGVRFWRLGENPGHGSLLGMRERVFVDDMHIYGRRR